MNTADLTALQSMARGRALALGLELCIGIYIVTNLVKMAAATVQGETHPH